MNPNTISSAQSLPTPTHSGVPNEMDGCPTFPTTAANETELNTAIACFNMKNIPGDYALTLTADIALTASTTQIDNTNANVNLSLNGGGSTVDGQGIAGVRPFDIAPDSTVTMQAITITGGTADTNGGAIYNQGDLAILESSLINNTAASNGGAIYNSGYLTIGSSAFISNTANGFGGAIGVPGGGALFATGSIFSANSAAVDGGAIHTTGGVLFISASRFQNNHAGSSAGAVWVEATNNWIGGSTFISNTAQEHGGALISVNPLSVGRTTFSGNSAEKSGGGLEVLGLATLIDSTVSGNTAGYGGGISLVDNGVLNLNRVTVSHNTAITAAGGISLTAGSAAYVLSTIIANSTGDDCAGRNYFNDLRYNLIEDGSCITDGTSISGDPNLGPLADNGGDTNVGYPTLTHALLPGSPVIDHIPNGQNSCGSAGVTDQRGVTRPQGSGCDIGAFEAAILPLNVAVVGSGSVSGPGINCGADCSESFYENTVITLTASANTGFILAGWSGDCSGTADCIIIMNTAKNVTATFAKPTYEIHLPVVIKND